MKLNESCTVEIRKKTFEPKIMNFTHDFVSQVIYVKLDSFDGILGLAEKSFSSGDFESCISYLDRYEKSDGNTNSGEYLRCAVLCAINDAEKAHEKLLMLSDVDENPWIRLLLADIEQYELNDLENAKKHLSEFLERSYDEEIKKRYESL